MNDENINDDFEADSASIQNEKRQRKLSLKGIALALENIQKERNGVFKRASKIKEKIIELWSSNTHFEEVKQQLICFNTLCEKASSLHETFVKDFDLPLEEKQKQMAWFDAKRAANDEFERKVRAWLNERGLNENDDTDYTQRHSRLVVTDDLNTKADGQRAFGDINPEDSASNVSKRSKHTCASGSSASSARRLALADQAALMEKAAALKRMHELEEQEERHRAEAERIRKHKEQIEMEAEIAAAAARVSVLEGSSICNKAGTNGMNSYVSKGIKNNRLTEFNPQAKEFVPKPDRLNDITHAVSGPVVRPKVFDNTRSYAQLHPKLADTKASCKLGLQINQRLVTSNGQSTDAVNPIASQSSFSAKTQQFIMPQAPIVPDNPICSIMQRQNEITSMLVRQQLTATLPQRDIPIFDGDPMQYLSFMRTFEHCVEERTSSYQDCLYFLEQYTRGQPRELVRSCMHMPSQQGYQRAKGLLMEHFGNEHKIATAYMERVLNWPSIKSEDVQELEDFALFLRGCCNAMTEIQYMEELNVPSYMRQVVMKWPYKMREKWRNAASEIQERRGFRATFTDLVHFLERQVKVLAHPLFGDISEGHATKGSVRNKIQSKGSFKGSSFATSITGTEDSIASSSRYTQQQPTMSVRSPSEMCLCCKQSHVMLKCPRLNKMSHVEKIDFLKAKGLCFGCLKYGHISRECRRRLTCDECQLKHPTLLHSDNREQQEKPPETPVSSALVSHQASACTGAGEQESTLSIVPVKVKSKKGDRVLQTYAFLDPGSTATFITSALMNSLNMQGSKTNILLRTMGQEKLVQSHCLTGLEISEWGKTNFIELPEVYTQESIPVSRSNIPRQQDIEKWEHLNAVSIPELDAEVGLLIGTNAAMLMEPWEIINSKNNGPYAVRTLLGWVINGPLRARNGDQRSYPIVHANRISVAKLEELLVSQYNQEFIEKAIEEEHEMSIEDKRFMGIMEETVCMKDGHYVVDLPFNKDEMSMPNNRCIVEQRMQSLRRKFQKNQDYRLEYTAFISELITKGYAEVVPCDQVEQGDRIVWYLPHHGVYHPRKRSLRVVFDCGASYKGISLNSQLLQGPDLTNSLFGVLTRFREESIALMTDIQAMFHQVKVSERHVDFLRFLWWPSGDTSSSLVEHRMTVHIFGAVSSPSCANYALRKTAADRKSSYSKQVTDTIFNNFYVDDCLKSVSTEKEAIQLVADLTDLCAKGGFQLLKWTSNSRAVLASVPEARRSKSTRQLYLDCENLPVEKALGLSWCAETDAFTFQLTLERKPNTRRGILSMVSSIFDPLGFLAPFTLVPKLLLQEMCRLNLSWDDPIPNSMAQCWTEWLKGLEKIAEFKVRRCIRPNDFEGPLHAQLHHFADGSDHGYGTVSYLRLQDKKGRVHLAFMLGKARVAPLKQTTIPRLELTAAVLAVKMDRMLKKELTLSLSSSCFWTDSQTVLKYINNNSKRFHTFVANRVAAIREATDPSQWRHVNSKSNPADEASRGLPADSFMARQRWISGPIFLTAPEQEWPEPFKPQPVSVEDPEVKKDLQVHAINTQAADPTSRLLHYFSSWSKLKISVAWVLKLRDTLLNLSRRRKEVKSAHSSAEPTLVPGVIEERKNKSRAAVARQKLSVSDLVRAEVAIIQYCQQTTFKDEISDLQNGASVVKRKSNIYKLDPVLHHGVLRVGGRLCRSALPAEQKHPLILSKGCHVSKLILRHIHQQLGHAGRNYMLSALRRKYWITNANAACRKTISECVVCRRYRGQPSVQKMADMPKERICADLPPFTNVGVDYFGPIEVKRGRIMVKRYGVIFTCMTSRAVHLEMAHSLTTDSCINAIRRFVCRRGPVCQMRSDNGTNFTGAERELREALAAVDHDKVHKALLSKEIDWVFNPPAASHHGGVWERLIRMIRKVLSSVLQQQIVDDESLNTILCEVEAILNDRPITGVSEDVNDLEPLTPNHILLLKGKPTLPPGVFQQSDQYVRRRWRQVQYLSDLFWKRWTREYLPLLQERQKWSEPRRSFAVGDVVVVMDNTAPRGSWILGRIINTYPDKNGLVRIVKLKTKTGQLERPISKIFLLQEAV